MRYVAILASFAVLVLSILATTFALLATTATDWSTQSYYKATNGQSPGNGQFDLTPVCTASRSPFYKCGIPQVYANGSCTIPACQFYPPYGYNATSCRSPAEFNGSWNYPNLANGLLGGDQECQQVHYAGNLQIAASVFITLGLILSLFLFVVPLTRQTWYENEREDEAGEEADLAGETRDEAREAAHQEAKPGGGLFRRRGRGAPHLNHQYSRSHDGGRPRPYPPLASLGPTAYVFRARVLFLATGAVLQLLAQFFGVLGLTIEAAPSGANAFYYQTTPQENYFVGHDWVIGRALSTYATIAWTTAMLSSGVAGSAWGIPRRFW